MTWRVVSGDCLSVLPTLEAGSVQCAISSPPYFGLRAYLGNGDPSKHLEIGTEPTPDEYVARLVAVFAEVKRVLRDDGTLWLNIGDSYHNYRSHNNGGAPTNTVHVGGSRDGTEGFARSNRNSRLPGMYQKDLIGIPWLLAFALRADGWYLRSEIIWHKPNPMPESVRDRCTKAHEQVFLLTKSSRYYYDAVAIAEESVIGQDGRAQYLSNLSDGPKDYSVLSGRNDGSRHSTIGYPAPDPATRNKRSVWTIPGQPFPGAHFAVMPEALVLPCILAGSKPGDVVLDPFAGAGTVGVVADRLERHFIGIELNSEYARIARKRIGNVSGPLFATEEGI